MPVARQDLMRKVYRRYFTLAGKFFPKLVGAEDFTKEQDGRQHGIVRFGACGLLLAGNRLWG
jgi:hypothetical protein